MRLLLDEQLSPAVADQLRRRAHDVVAVAEVGLRGVPDELVLAQAIGDRRAIVTGDIRDFRALHAGLLMQGKTHYGVVLVPGRFRLSPRGIGGLVKALDELLNRFPGSDSLRDSEYFL